jgi:SAM-dependent methyltransferase
MFDREAKRLCEILLGRENVSPILNIGSSTRRFREVEKPHIDRELFAPLRKAGIEVVHCDLKAAEGVDLVADIYDDAILESLKAQGFRCVLLSNVLEHVRDRESLARRCEDIVGKGGFVLVSAPYSYPYHADPLDTGYRPSPKALARLFTQSICLHAETLSGRTYVEDVLAKGSTLWREALRTALWTLIFFARPRSWASRVHRWFWLFRPYRVSIALFEVKSLV